MIEGEVRRRVLTPYWTSVHPLRWVTPEGIGLAHFALEGHVGMFNVCWWMLGCNAPPQARVYKETNLMWAITLGQVVQLRPGLTINDCAAMMTAPEWVRLLASQVPRLGGQLYRQGMTPQQLAALCRRVEA